MCETPLSHTKPLLHRGSDESMVPSLASVAPLGCKEHERTGNRYVKDNIKKTI